MKDGLYTFIGKNSLSYKRGATYSLRFHNPKASTVSGIYYAVFIKAPFPCPYVSEQAFWNNWLPVQGAFAGSGNLNPEQKEQYEAIRKAVLKAVFTRLLENVEVLNEGEPLFPIGDLEVRLKNDPEGTVMPFHELLEKLTSEV